MSLKWSNILIGEAVLLNITNVVFVLLLNWTDMAHLPY